MRRPDSFRLPRRLPGRLVRRLHVPAFLAASALAMVLATLPLHADPADEAREHFKQAIAAVEGGSWAEAESQLRRAIALDPVADKRTFAKNYLPHYWLGVTLQEQGKCRAALHSWAEAREQGVATETRDALDMPRRRTVCETEVETLEAAAAEARTAIEQARGADAALARLADSPELAAHWAPFETRRQAALQSLVEAERRLERADQAEDLDAVRKVADDASQVGSRLHTIAADARSKAGQVSSASARAEGDLDEAEAAAGSALRAVQALEPLPPELEAQAMEVRRLLEEVDDVRRRSRPADTRRHSRELAEAIRGLKNLALPPPTWLADAAQAYLDQDFAAALEILDRALGRAEEVDAEGPEDSAAGGSAGDTQSDKSRSDERRSDEALPEESRSEENRSGEDPVGGTSDEEITVESDRERFHALILAAAARHQLWVAGGEENDELGRLVADDLDAAVALETADPEMSLGRPSPRFLSPRLRALWIEAGGTPAEGSLEPTPGEDGAPAAEDDGP